MGSKGLKSVIMCVLVLGLILDEVQVEGKSCCKNIIARNCYNVCRLKGPRSVCSQVCGCKIISGTKCPSDFPKLHIPPNSGEPDTTQYCKLGCRSSVCDTMNSGFAGEQMEIDMELCSDVCDNFCNTGDARIESVAA